jgi:hypothetical protein
MNATTRFSIVASCVGLCASGIIIANSPRAHAKIDNGNNGSGAFDLAEDYQYAATAAEKKLTFKEIESIIRRDPTAKPSGRMEFGSIKMERGAALVQVLFVEGDGATKGFLYKLVPDRSSWKVASAQRLWFVPRSYLLRGVRV